MTSTFVHFVSQVRLWLLIDTYFPPGTGALVEWKSLVRTRTLLDLPSSPAFVFLTTVSPHVKHLKPVVSANPNPTLSSRVLLGVLFPHRRASVPFSCQGKCKDWKCCFSPSSYSALPQGWRSGSAARTWHLLSLSQVSWWVSNWAPEARFSLHPFVFFHSVQGQGVSPLLFWIQARGVLLCFLSSSSKHTWMGPRSMADGPLYSGWEDRIQNLPFKCT